MPRSVGERCSNSARESKPTEYLSMDGMDGTEQGPPLLVKDEAIAATGGRTKGCKHQILWFLRTK